MAREDTQFKKGHIPANKKVPVVIVCKHCNWIKRLDDIESNKFSS